MNEIDPQEFGELKARVDFLVSSDAGKTELLRQLAADMQAVRMQLAEASGVCRPPEPSEELLP